MGSLSDVLDASAVLAWLRLERGADVVRPLLPGAVVSAVNWAEILQKATATGRDPGAVTRLIEAYGVTVVDATRGDAILAARFWEPRTQLSLADRFCLGLAYRLGARAVTADRSWADFGTDVEVLAIR